MKNAIGIMQGRLSPPVNERIQAFPLYTWEQEFFWAKEVGLDHIDWVIDNNTLHKNPLFTAQGREVIKDLVSKTGVHIEAVCAHYFTECPLIRCTESELKERLNVLDSLIENLSNIGIKYLELPFLDNSVIKNKTELDQILQIIQPRLDKVYQQGAKLAFETSLSPKLFKDFLLNFNHPAAGITYDMGNSASLGYDPAEELETYGDLIVTVHIKDRLLKGRTVFLGGGNADFDICFSILRSKKYPGPFILEVARVGNEIESARNNLSFVKNFLKE